VLTDRERAEAVRLFSAHGYDAPLRVARVTSEDERVFVVPPAAFAALPEQSLAADLQKALGRKVWIVSDSDSWESEPLQ